MLLNVQVRRLTIAGAAAAIVTAVSQADTIVSSIETHFGASPYLFVVASYRYELIFLVVVGMLVYYLYDIGFLENYPRLRLNWVTSPAPLWRASLHPEEWGFLIVALVLALSLIVHCYFKAARIYQAYGLHYVAEKLCTGDFDAALERMKVLKSNPLWEKYRAELQAAIERNTYVKSLVDRRLASLQADRDRDSAEVLSAEAMELKVIFGSNAWRSIDLKRGPASTVQWRDFLSKARC
jgi:hypothetical protein